MRQILLSLCLLLTMALPAIAQVEPQAIRDQSPSQKGKWQVFWGWNRDVYSKSTLHFWGDQYNFVLRDVDAHDFQAPLGISPYFNPLLITLPQTNARIGYFFRPQTSISVGLDHMKYVMDQIQAVEIAGHIGGTGTVYDGNYLHHIIYTKTSFLTFEHTDGLNYLNVELRRHSPIASTHRSKWCSLDVETFSGVGAGILIPKTNSKLFGGQRHDDYHLSGYGVNVLTGVGLTLWDHLVIQPEFKGGFINMPDIRTTHTKSDRAAQHFWFGEFAVMVGGSFRLPQRNR